MPTSDAFAGVAESSKKVGEPISEIAAATNEQAQGIDQVNTAVAEIDKVTQQNAANAQESASASEDLNLQTKEMWSAINELLALFTKKAQNSDGIKPVSSTKMNRAIPVHHPSKFKAPIRKIASDKSTRITPRHVDAFEGNDFEDF